MSSTEAPQPFYAVLFGSILCIGFPLNAIGLWSLLRHHSFKLPNVMFMVNLAISDVLLAASLPLRVYYYATGTWPFGDIVCIWAKALLSLNIRSSSIFITFISVDRLLAIVYPLRSRHIRTAGNALKAVVIVWVFVICLSIPKCILMERRLKYLNGTSCFDHSKQGRELRMFHKVEGYVQFTLVLVLLTVNIVSTVLVSVTLRSKVKDLSKINSKVNVLLLFAMSLVMFAVCFVPETVCFFGQRYIPFLKWLGALNCCLDPVFYYFSMDAFWKKKEDRNQLKPRNVI